ncbi:MAG: primosomal protein N' [Victivallaceae bacterium]|nr:primosomal protein N' [Victivallaceae bacterium]
MIAKVITDVSLDREFEYVVPPELEKVLRCGSAVVVPFGRSRREGYVLSLGQRAEFREDKLKAVSGLSPVRASIPEKLVELGRWMAEYYCCPLEHAIRTLLPAAVRNGKVRPLVRRIYSLADRAEAEKFVASHLADRRAEGRCALLRALLSGGDASSEELKRLPGFGDSALKTLLRHGLLVFREEMCRRDVFGDVEVIPDSPLEPTPDQANALAGIDRMLEHRSGVMLLHGVTNSGKTEVYLQAIASALARGRSAIVLVPEISLTPQTVRRFRARFGDDLSVLHSRLSDGERFDEWMRIASGKVKIAVGARSALFAPFSDLGLIVVDEEHESTYKQSESPRYHARDVAVMRGKMENACVILGSATPSAESMHNVSLGKFLLAEMRSQVGARPAPRFTVVDRRIGEPGGENGIFSPELVENVRRRLAGGAQAILFLSRRGYARTLRCPQCGYEACCPDCDVNYVYSKRRETLSCHLCGAVVPAPEICPQCKSPEIRYLGSGTEKIESVARALFPDARIARMDSDSMRGANDYEAVLDRFRRGEIDLLVGTQMIAKGLHFPNVTLVGILNADQNLSMPDFRASERAFQLITQVAGRAGRGDRPGEVVLQTFSPENDVIRYAAEGDFAGFSRFDLEFREMMKFPPFSRMIAVFFKGEDDAAVEAAARTFSAELAPYIRAGVTVAGPLRAPIERIRGKYRYLLTLRGDRLGTVRRALRVLALHRTFPGNVEISVDVDPLDFM